MTIVINCGTQLLSHKIHVIYSVRSVVTSQEGVTSDIEKDKPNKIFHHMQLQCNSQLL